MHHELGQLETSTATLTGQPAYRVACRCGWSTAWWTYLGNLVAEIHRHRLGRGLPCHGGAGGVRCGECK